MLKTLLGPLQRKDPAQTDVLGLIEATVRDGKTDRMLFLTKKDAQIALDKSWDILGSSSTLGHQSEYPSSLYGTPTRRSILRRISVKLAWKHDILPSTIFLRNIKRLDPHSRHEGAFADVYYAEHHDIPVALKRIRLFATTSEEDKQEKMKALYVETLLWKGLSHTNVLPFLGVSDVFKGTMCIVSLWRPNTIRQHWSDFRTRGWLSTRVVNRWLVQIALGLAYLHEEGVIHGDLHGGNVLVDEKGIPQLTDFGMAVIADAMPYAYHSMHGGEAVRWTAPELLDPESAGLTSSRPTKASDVYSFACLSIELYTGEKPFPALGDHQVQTHVLRGERPPRPSLPEGKRMKSNMWELIESCWAASPQDRSRSRDIPRQLILTAPIKTLVPTSEVVELPIKREDRFVLNVALSENYIVILTRSSIEVYSLDDLAHHDTLNVPSGREFYWFAVAADTVAVCSQSSTDSQDCTIHVWDLPRYHRGHFTIRANSVKVAAVRRDDAGHSNIHAARPTFMVVCKQGLHGIGALTAPDKSVIVPVVAAPLLDSEFYQCFSLREKVPPLRNIIAQGGHALAWCNDSKVRRWDIADGSCTRVIETQDKVKAISIDPFDEGMACITLNSQVAVWDLGVVSKPRTGVLKDPTMSSEGWAIIHLNHVIGKDQSGKVHIWTYDFTESRTLSHGDEIITWFSAIQGSVITKSWTKLMVWDIVTGAELQSFDLKSDRWGRMGKEIWESTSLRFRRGSRGLAIWGGEGCHKVCFWRFKDETGN